MSQTPRDVPPATVSMRKKRATAGGAAPGSAGRSPARPPSVAIPRTIDLAAIAVVAEAFFTLVRALSVRGSTSQLSQWLIDTNNKATGKNHKANYTIGSRQVAHDLAQLRSRALTQGLIIAVALVLLAVAIRRTRAASGARWALLLVIVLTSGPLAIMPVDGWPTVPKAAGVLMGVCAIAAIVLIVLPQSMNYFRACKVASRPAGASARPGLAGMFAPRSASARGAAASSPARTAAKPGQADSGLAPQTAEDGNPARARAKAKVRADADAVAKGAELARARAKARKPGR